jgi:hypothetical protein
MLAVIVPETISCLADRVVGVALVFLHWELSMCVRSQALGDATASAFLQD